MLQATHTQAAALLDERYAAAADPAVVPVLGAEHRPAATRFTVWASTAQRVALCLHAPGAEAAMHLDGRGLSGAGPVELVYAINAGTTAAVLTMPGLKGRALALHPVHTAAGAADPRPAQAARWDAAPGPPVRTWTAKRPGAL